MVFILTLSEIFDENVGPFSEFLCLMEVSRIRFLGLFWNKWLPFSTNFPRIMDFWSKLGPSYQTIRSSFGLSFVSSK